MIPGQEETLMGCHIFSVAGTTNHLMQVGGAIWTKRDIYINFEHLSRKTSWLGNLTILDST